jgi:hypothetical protein
MDGGRNADREGPAVKTNAARGAPPAAGAFLAGARNRLLPLSLPFRFFGAAVVFHVLAWVALLAAPGHAASFAGGLGWPLAALHLITLGVLAMTAIGASLQLLPVATRAGVRWPRAVAAVWWLYVPGVAALALGMGRAQPLLLVAGAALVALALVVYAVLLACNLAAARGMPVGVAHGCVALASLLVVLGTAASLAAAYAGVPLLARGRALALHVVFAGYGVMGMLAFGLSYIAVPMFALSEAPDPRRARLSCALAVPALALGGVAAVMPGSAPTIAAALRVAAIVIGAAATLLHLALMRTALATGLRRELGVSFRLVGLAWGSLVASFAAAAALALDAPLAGSGAVFGVLLVGGWLLSFALGILQRIVPFLAAMHASGAKPRSPAPSALAANGPLVVHGWCHGGALVVLVVAFAAQSAALVVAAAAAGTVGALAFAWVFAVVVERTQRARATIPAPRESAL